MRLPRLMLVVCGLVVGCACRKPAPRLSDPEESAVRTAAAFVDRFHQDLSGAHVDNICRAVAPDALKATTQLPCPEFMRDLNSKLGPFVSARRPQLPIASDKPLRVGMEYLSDWKNGPAREHFEFLIHGENAILTSYRIRSEAVEKR